MKASDGENPTTNPEISETKSSEKITKNILLKQEYTSSKESRRALLQKLKSNDKELTELDLSGYDFKPGELKELLDALKTNSIVTKLNLSYSNIGYDGIKIISELIGTNKFLKQINLSGNDIGDKGLEVLCPALQSSNIEELNLSYNDIGDKGARIIANLMRTNKSIAILDLALDNIKSDGAIAIASIVEGSSLTSLNLSNNNLGVEAVNTLDIAARANGTLLGVAYCVVHDFEKQAETLAPSLIKTAKTLKAKISASYTPSKDVADNLANIMDISSSGLVMNIVNKIAEYDERTEKKEKYLFNVRDANAYDRQLNLEAETMDLDVFLHDDQNYESLSAAERPCENMSLSDFLGDEKKEPSLETTRRPNTAAYQPVARQGFMSKLFGVSKTNTPT